MVSAANARANAMKRIAMVTIVSAKCEESMQAFLPRTYNLEDIVCAYERCE